MKAELTGTHLVVQSDLLAAGGSKLVDAFRFDVPCGQVMLIKGPNGSGKSTLLNQIANSLGGQAVLLKPPFALREELTVSAQAEALQLAVAGNQTDVELLSAVGLEHWAEDRVSELSSGQKARLGFLQLQSTNSPVWLLDEPANALDYQALCLLRERLIAHLAEGGIVVLAAHLGAEQLLEGVSEKYRQLIWISEGRMNGASTQEFSASSLGASDAPRTVPVSSSVSVLIKREKALAFASIHQLFWSGLYLLMAISFYAFALPSVTPEVGLVVVWVGVLLGLLLVAKDWFLEDYRCGWLSLISRQAISPQYWLAKMLVLWLGLGLTFSAVGAVAGAFFNLDINQVGWLIGSIWIGLGFAVPMSSLMALMVLMAKNGAVLVYLLAMPLLLPILVFGLEAARASGLERSPWPAFGVLLAGALLVFLIGPKVAAQLIRLIQE